MRLHRTLIVSSALIVLSTARASSQSTGSSGDSVPRQLSGTLFGASIGMAGLGRETFPELLTLGLQWTQAEAGRPGLDFSLGTAPRAFFEGGAVLGARGGFALPLVLSPRIVVLPSGGGTFIAVAGSEVLAAMSGFNTGLGLVVLTRSRGFRTGITWHWLEEDSAPLWLWEFGVVSLPRP
jgi:hypothetical protein